MNAKRNNAPAGVRGTRAGYGRRRRDHLPPRSPREALNRRGTSRRYDLSTGGSFHRGRRRHHGSPVGTESRQRPLRCKGQLRRRDDDFRSADVEVAQFSNGRGVSSRWRFNHGRFRTAQCAARAGHIRVRRWGYNVDREGRQRANSVLNFGRRCDNPLFEQSQTSCRSLIKLRRRRDDLIRQHGHARSHSLECCARHGDTVIAPGNNIGRIDIVIDLDIGRRDDGLMTIIRFRRNRENALPRELRISLDSFRRMRTAGINRRQEFRGRVVNGVPRIESADLHDVPLWRKQRGYSPRHREHDQVIKDRFCKSSPRQPLGNKHVMPKGGGWGSDTNGRRLAAHQRIPEISPESRPPRLEVKQKAGRRMHIRPGSQFRGFGDIFQT